MPSGLSTIVSTLPTAEKAKVEWTFVDAMGKTYILALVAGVLALVLGPSKKVGTSVFAAGGCYLDCFFI